MGIFDRQPTNTNAAWERDKKRAKEREAAQLEEKRKKALAAGEDTGLMEGDPSARTVQKEDKEGKAKKIASILADIQGGHN